MKAITVTFKGFTSTKPSRYIVRAEGLPAKTYGKFSFTEKEAATDYANQYKWLDDGSELIEAELPNGDRVFVLHKH